MRIGEQPALNSPRTQSRSRLSVMISKRDIKKCGKGNALFFVSVNIQCRPSILTKVLCDIICNMFCRYKDEDLHVFGTNLIEVLDQFCTFLKVAAHFNDLLDIMVGSEFRRIVNARDPPLLRSTRLGHCETCCA